MKNFFTLLFLSITLTTLNAQATYNSKASGIWASAGTWTLVSGTPTGTTGIPGKLDHVNILATHAVSLTTNSRCKSVTVNATSKFYGGNKLFDVFGNFTNMGSLFGSFNIFMQGANSTFSCTVPYINSGTIFIQKTCTISAGTVINKPGTIVVQNPGTKVYNFGNITLYNSSTSAADGVITVDNAGATWYNKSGSSLKVSHNNVIPANSLDCSEASNTVEYTGKATKCTNGLYYNLIISSKVTKNFDSKLRVLNNLTFSASSLNITNTNGHSIAVGGNVAFGAVVNFNATDTLILNGTSATTQTVSGSYTSIDNLEINNTGGAGAVFVTRQGVTNNLVMTKGDLNSGSNKLFLESNASTTARIASIATPSNVSFSGIMIVQKYLPADAGSDYPYFAHDLSSPIQSTNINDWDNELFISGIGDYDGVGGPAGVDGDVYNGYQSMTHYDEPSNTYVPLTGSLTTLDQGVGYTMLLLDQIDGTTLDGTFAAKTMDTRGVPNYGDITIPVTIQNFGWNIVGNPYASAITLTTGVSSTGTMPTYIYFTEFGNYTYEDIDYQIAPHQGFLLEMQGSSDETITFTEACKVDDNATAFRRTKPKYDIKLNIASSSAIYNHEAHISFNENAHINYDDKLDAKYLQHPLALAPAIYMLDEEKNITILKNVVNDAPDQLAIPLGIFTPKAGVYYIDASVLNMANYNYAWIENKVTGATYDINSALPIEGKEKATNKDYVFHLAKTKQSGNSIEKTILENDLIIFSTENTINLKSSYTNHTITDVLVYDMTGKLVLTETNVDVVAGVISKIDVTNLASGIYVVKVFDNQGRTSSNKLVK